MNAKHQRVTELLRTYNQEHLMTFYPSLSAEAQEQLLDQILAIDFERMAALHRDVANTAPQVGEIAPIAAHAWNAFDEAEQRQFSQKGWELLAEGKVGALVVAGGQGSRLGHMGPKGTYDIGLPSHKPLFQLQAERLLNLSGRAGRIIPWYVMTSPENNQETIRFFQAADYFGYPQEDVVFFIQDVLPAVDPEGKILLADKDQVNLAPSGNGGCFAAFGRSGALDDMKRRGVDWLFYYNVDNALVKVADPDFIGFAAYLNHPVASKVVPKSSAEEKVGILCLQDGRPSVLEYSDAPQELLLATDEQGQLLYRQANISMHLFRRDFVETCASLDLPYHVAHKKISTIDAQGNPVVPTAPNAYKFELFIFDVFPHAEQMAVLEVTREEEFAPVKNKDGADSPDTARQLLLNLHRNWLLAAGVAPERLEGRQVEVSGLTSYGGEGLGPDVLSGTEGDTVLV